MSDEREIRIAPAALAAAVLGVLFVADVLLTADLLPQRVASHFGFDGRADGWMSRDGYVGFILATGLGLALLVPAVTRFTLGLPPWAVGIPHAEVWLAPARRAATLAFMTQHALWLSCLMLVFVTGMHHLTVEANRADPARLELGSLLVLLAGLVAAVALWSWILHRHFATAP